MTTPVWDKIAKLAKDILGDTAPVPADFSALQNQIIPEQGQQTPTSFTSWQAPQQDIEVLPEYNFILQALQAGCPSIFVTGKAGTGKSTLIQWLCQQLEGCAVVAPTAIAAVNVRGDTIHSFFGLPPTHIDPDGNFEIKDRSRLVLENVKCLIVDEVSMVLPNIVDAMSTILQKVRRNNIPFGGVPTLFIGDLLQLPPVVDNQELSVFYTHRYKTPFFFSADVFRDQQIMPVHLTKVRRQSDAEFIEALNHIRLNDNSRDYVALFNRRCYRDKQQGSPTGVYLVPTNAAAKTINTRELDALPGGLQLFEAVVTGNIPVNQWKLAVPDRLELKVGARVIFLKNNKPHWINGDIGEVAGMEADHIRVKKQKSDNVVLVAKETWYKLKYTYNHQSRKIEQEPIGTFSQLPVSLGWAVTIHKSQGLTLEHLTLDLGGGTFAAGQLYVALSRAKSIEGITLAKPIAMQDVKAAPEVLEFYRLMGLDS